MFGLKSLPVAATFGLLLPLQALAKAGAQERRELTYALRQLYAREVYDVSSEPNAPSCAEGYDTYDASTGDCTCGAGRTQVTNGLCAVANGGGEFRTVALTSPQRINTPITWSYYVSGPGNVLNAAQCGGVCSEDDACIGYYLTPAADEDTAYCWLLGNSDVYDSPEGTGLPFTPVTNARVKRATGVEGDIGVEGGILGISQAVQATNPAVGCNTDLGDQASADFTGCVCGPGRVNNAEGNCYYPASAAARLTRRVKRDAFEGVPW